jgi:hypothetical protein
MVNRALVIWQSAKKTWTHFREEFHQSGERRTWHKLPLSLLSLYFLIALLSGCGRNMAERVWVFFARKYAWEQEVRAFPWIHRPDRGGNRHIDGEGRIHPHELEPPPERIPKGERRSGRSEKAHNENSYHAEEAEALTSQVGEIVRNSGYEIPVAPLAFAAYRYLLPDPT